MISPTEAQRLAERVRPKSAPVMHQRWSNLLFLHWAWDPVAIQKTLPPGLTVDLFGGRAWVGIVPFFMEGVRARSCPPFPGLSAFLELNVRTYVHDASGRPGVWFYSLDCNQWLAVKAARTFFHLPYQHATMRAVVDADNGEVEYEAWRRDTPEEMASRFVYRAPPAETAKEAEPGTLEFFLLERYRLFAHDAERGWLWSGRVHHEPYRFGVAEVSEWNDAMLRLSGFDCDGRSPDHICATNPQRVEVWPLVRVTETVRADDEAGEALGPVVVVPA